MFAPRAFEHEPGGKLKSPRLFRAPPLADCSQGESGSFSAAPGSYQPPDAPYALTQACLEVCRDFRNPVAIITKSFLVTRDVELIKQVHQNSVASVTVSIPFATDEMAKKIEPQASSITRRFKAVEMFAKAGVP